MTNAAAAIRHALTCVTDLQPIGNNSYFSSYWSDHHNAWYQGHPAPYPQAVRNRADLLITEALVYLGMDRDDAGFIGHSHESGNWRSVVRREAKAL